MKTKLFTLLLAIMANIGTMLASYKVDGLYYNIIGDQAYVTYSNYGGTTTQPINYGWNITTANIPTTITINSGTYSVVGIGNYAFEGCSSLTSVTIPNSIIGISDVAFLYCNKLLYVTIDSDYLFKKNDKSRSASRIFGGQVQEYILGNSVTTIGDGAFYNCADLKNINIPNSVTSIGSCAFEQCRWLTSITIPNSVTSIGDSAFYNCRQLKEMIIESTEPCTLGNDVFEGTYPIYVPCGYLDIYKQAWKQYADRIKDMGQLDIRVTTNKAEHGYVKVQKMEDCEIQIEAIPDEGYHFVRWSDDNTDNPRIVPNKKTTYTAEFVRSVPITVRLDAESAEGWSNVRIYYWGENIGNQPSVNWPGKNVTKEDNKWYSYTFDNSVEKVNIIWTDGTNQTVNITDVSNSTCYQLNSTNGKAITVNEVECTHSTYYTVVFQDWDERVISTQQVEHGKSATAPANPLRDGYRFIGWDKDFTNVQSDLIITAQYSKIDNQDNPITVRLDAESAKGWPEVRLYYWGYESGDGLSTTWPGIVLNKDNNGWYSYTFDKSVNKVNIIWTDGINQTVDITNVSNSTCYQLNSTNGTAITVSVVECTTTGIENVIYNEQNTVRKIIEDGHIFIILPDGRRYNILGAEVK